MLHRFLFHKRKREVIDASLHASGDGWEKQCIPCCKSGCGQGSTTTHVLSEWNWGDVHFAILSKRVGHRHITEPCKGRWECALYFSKVVSGSTNFYFSFEGNRRGCAVRHVLWRKWAGHLITRTPEWGWPFAHLFKCLVQWNVCIPIAHAGVNGGWHEGFALLSFL